MKRIGTWAAIGTPVVVVFGYLLLTVGMEFFRPKEWDEVELGMTIKEADDIVGFPYVIAGGKSWYNRKSHRVGLREWELAVLVEPNRKVTNIRVNRIDPHDFFIDWIEGWLL